MPFSKLIKATMITTTTLSLSACALVGGVFGVRSSYEAPDYLVVSKVNNKVEIREYEKRLVAEVSVNSANGSESEDEAFRILFDYITGDNTTSEEISMTVPVSTSSTETSYNSSGSDNSEKIAMTVPVETSQTDDAGTSMKFYFPSKYTLETAPVPTDERISIFEAPAQKVAVYDVSGWKDRSSLVEAKRSLIAELEKTNWKAEGEPSMLYYDPPFTIPYFRRTEAIVEVYEK